MKQENIVSINIKIRCVKLLQQPKRGIFRTNLTDMKVMAKKHRKQLIMPFIENHVKQYLMQYLSKQN